MQTGSSHKINVAVSVSRMIIAIAIQCPGLAVHYIAIYTFLYTWCVTLITFQINLCTWGVYTLPQIGPPHCRINCLVLGAVCVKTQVFSKLMITGISINDWYLLIPWSIKC